MNIFIILCLRLKKFIDPLLDWPILCMGGPTLMGTGSCSPNWLYKICVYITAVMFCSYISVVLVYQRFLLVWRVQYPVTESFNILLLFCLILLSADPIRRNIILSQKKHHFHVIWFLCIYFVMHDFLFVSFSLKLVHTFIHFFYTSMLKTILEQLSYFLWTKEDYQKNII